MTEPVLYEKNGPIATITINRPVARNALTPQMLCLLADAFVDFRDDAQLRVAILTGSGDKAFCAGGDLGEHAAAADRRARAGGRVGQAGAGRAAGHGCVVAARI